MQVTHILGSAINALGIRTGESPKYDVIHEDGELEIRRYQAFLRAKTFAAGNYAASSGAGFKRLASFISGHNSGGVRLYSQDSFAQSNLRGEHIAMTAPVLQAPVVSERRWGLVPFLAVVAQHFAFGSSVFPFFMFHSV